MDKYEIAKELTLAIVDKIRHTDDSTKENINKTLAIEVGKAYQTILAAVDEVSANPKTGNKPKGF